MRSLAPWGVDDGALLGDCPPAFLLNTNCPHSLNKAPELAGVWSQGGLWRGGGGAGSEGLAAYHLFQLLTSTPYPHPHPPSLGTVPPFATHFQVILWEAATVYRCRIWTHPPYPMYMHQCKLYRHIQKCTCLPRHKPTPPPVGSYVNTCA